MRNGVNRVRNRFPAASDLAILSLSASPTPCSEVLMNAAREPQCPECQDPAGVEPTLDRRNFIRVVGGAAAVAVAGGVPVGRAIARQPKPAEALIRELHSTLDAEQKRTLVV